MVMLNNLRPDLPREALEDCFRPPAEAVAVHCIHCGREYSSELILWEAAPDSDAGFWRCPYPDCSGAGYEFDILPIDGEGWVDCDDEEDLCEDCSDPDCEACELFDEFDEIDNDEAGMDTFWDEDDWYF
jgi:hypothetical protein